MPSLPLVRKAAIVMALVFVMATLAQEGPAEEENECASQPVEEYNWGLRIGSLFIIMVTSALGVFTPMILHRSPPTMGGLRDWILVLGKFFGTGVILATAFVHMLPDALENFGSPCLTDGWLAYGGAFAGVFCMIASFALQLLELAAVAHLQRALAHNHPTKTDEDTLSVQPDAVPHHGGDDHAHAAVLFLEQDDAFRHIGTFVLELGIVMHSVLIGMALATSGNDEFITLLIALVFHQFFEGVALGTRINELPHKGWLQSFVMGLIFSLTTPVGVAIGLGIHSSFNPNSYASVLSQAILDSLSAGILLYNAYVSLMSMEINHNMAFRRATMLRKVCCFLSMYTGAGLMSLLGKWA